MSGTMKRLKAELTSAAELAASVMRRAQEDGERELTTDERAEVDTQLAKARDLRARLGNVEENDRRQAEIAALLDVGRDALTTAIGASRSTRAGYPVASLGRQWIESPAMDYFRQGLHRRGGAAWASPAIELMAATITSDVASGGALVSTQEVPGIIPIPSTPTRVADLFAQGTTTAGSISYLIETAATNAAAAVAETAAKPESTLTFDARTEALAKVATWIPVSEEMLADVDQMESYINARLSIFVALKMDEQILSGSGVAPNMLGILNTPGLSGPITAGATEKNADAVFRAALTVMTASFLVPDGIVLNPADWAGVVLMKNTAGDYIAPGAPYAAMPTPSLWGVRVVTTPAITQGTGLVGAFQQGGQVWFRGGITVQASNSHADYFVKNIVAIRAEQRALLTTYRPTAFAKVTGLDSGLGTPAILEGSETGGGVGRRAR